MQCGAWGVSRGCHAEQSTATRHSARYTRKVLAMEPTRLRAVELGPQRRIRGTMCSVGRGVQSGLSSRAEHSV